MSQTIPDSTLKAVPGGAEPLPVSAVEAEATFGLGLLQIETEVPESLVPLLRLVQRSSNFTLGFVVCNRPTERRRLEGLVAKAISAERRVRRIETAHSAQDLLDQILVPGAIERRGDVVFVSDLESLVPSDVPHPALLTLLNQLRERFREFAGAVVFWVSDYLLTRIARESPDFWAWRSGVFEVEPMLRLQQMSSADIRLLAPFDVGSLANLPRGERDQLYESLQRLWQDYQTPGAADPNRQSSLAVRLAILAYLSGQLMVARDWIELAFSKNESHVYSGTLGLLLQVSAMIELQQGNPFEARKLLQQLLKTGELQGDQHSLSATLWQLAHIETNQGNTREARRLLERSLKIEELQGDQRGLSMSLWQLAIIELQEENVSAARRLLKRSITIDESLGDQSALSASLGQLAMVESIEGNVAEARRLLQRSIAIDESLGNQCGLSAGLNQLATIELGAGNRNETRVLLDRSRSINQFVGDVAGLAETKLMLAQLDLSEGRTQRASELAEQAVQELEQLGYAQATQAREVLAEIRRRAAEVRTSGVKSD